MRLTSIVMWLVLGSATSAAAQETVVGLKAGLNVASLKYEGEDANVELDPRTGFTGGLFVVWPADERLALQLEALYSRKGASVEVAGFQGTAGIDFIEVPMLVRLSGPRKGRTSFHAIGGPSLGFRVSGEERLRFEGDSFRFTISDKIKRMDVGFMAGGGIDVGRFVVDGRYTWGMSELNDDPGEEVTIKNRVFSVMAGVRF